MSYQSTFMMSDSWQVDYIEGEVTEEQRADMELLLQHSPMEKQVVDNLGKLKESIRWSDETQVPEAGKYWQGLHMKIMDAVNESSDLKWKKEKSSRKRRNARR